MDTIWGILFGIGLSLVGWLMLRLTGRMTGGARTASVSVHSSIEDIRSIGELSVFKIMTKEIVTATDHWLGEIGKKYFSWMISSKKMAMIIAFDIDFRYDLRSPDFKIRVAEDGTTAALTMPRCFYETHIQDVLFYDEQSSKLLPWLLPDLLNRAFGPGFNEEDKNRLIEEAKRQAAAQAKALVHKMRSEVQASASETLQALARGFGVRRVTVDFLDSDPVPLKVNYSASDAQPTVAA